MSNLAVDGKSKQRKVSKLTVVQSGNMKLSLAVQQSKYNAGEIRLKLSPGCRDAVNKVNFCKHSTRTTVKIDILQTTPKMV